MIFRTRRYFRLETDKESMIIRNPDLKSECEIKTNNFINQNVVTNWSYWKRIRLKWISSNPLTSSIHCILKTSKCIFKKNVEKKAKRSSLHRSIYVDRIIFFSISNLDRLHYVIRDRSYIIFPICDYFIQFWSMNRSQVCVQTHRVVLK